MKTVNIAMLGSGFVADFYLQGLSNVNGQQVVVNYSRSKPRGAAFAQKWSIPETTSDLDGVVARTDIDLYIIALPNEIHLPVSLSSRRRSATRRAPSPSRGTAAKPAPCSTPRRNPARSTATPRPKSSPPPA